MNGRHVDWTIRTSIGSRHVGAAVVVALIVVVVVVVGGGGGSGATRCPSNSI
jgi:Flp pilus assembly CpaF family ATPase